MGEEPLTETLHELVEAIARHSAMLTDVVNVLNGMERRISDLERRIMTLGRQPPGREAR